MTQEKYESAWTRKNFKAILEILATMLTNIAREEIYGGMSMWQGSFRRHTPCKRAKKAINEETFTTDTTSRTDTSIVLRMQGIKQSTVDQISRPYHWWWRHKEALGNATNRKANQLGRHDKKPLIYQRRGRWASAISLRNNCPTYSWSCKFDYNTRVGQLRYQLHMQIASQQ